MSDDGQFSDYEENISKQVKSVRVSQILIFQQIYNNIRYNFFFNYIS